MDDRERLRWWWAGFAGGRALGLLFAAGAFALATLLSLSLRPYYECLSVPEGATGSTCEWRWWPPGVRCVYRVAGGGSVVEGGTYWSLVFGGVALGLGAAGLTVAYRRFVRPT